jgi:hypothetical protein
MSSMTTTEIDKALKPTFTMTAADRCDHCGSRAYVQVTINIEKSPLQFCGHHFTLHEVKLRAVSLDLLDERENLLSNDRN